MLFGRRIALTLTGPAADAKEGIEIEDEREPVAKRRKLIEDIDTKSHKKNEESPKRQAQLGANLSPKPAPSRTQGSGWLQTQILGVVEALSSQITQLTARFDSFESQITQRLTICEKALEVLLINNNSAHLSASPNTIALEEGEILSSESESRESTSNEPHHRRIGILDKNTKLIDDHRRIFRIRNSSSMTTHPGVIAARLSNLIKSRTRDNSIEVQFDAKMRILITSKPLRDSELDLDSSISLERVDDVLYATQKLLMPKLLPIIQIRLAPEDELEPRRINDYKEFLRHNFGAMNLVKFFIAPNGKSLFVEFESIGDANEAIKKFNGRCIGDTPQMLVVTAPSVHWSHEELRNFNKTAIHFV